MSRREHPGGASRDLRRLRRPSRARPGGAVPGRRAAGVLVVVRRAGGGGVSDRLREEEEPRLQRNPPPAQEVQLGPEEAKPRAAPLAPRDWAVKLAANRAHVAAAALRAARRGAERDEPARLAGSVIGKGVRGPLRHRQQATLATGRLGLSDPPIPSGEYVARAGVARATVGDRAARRVMLRAHIRHEVIVP